MSLLAKTYRTTQRQPVMSETRGNNYAQNRGISRKPSQLSTRPRSLPIVSCPANHPPVNHLLYTHRQNIHINKTYHTADLVPALFPRHDDAIPTPLRRRQSRQQRSCSYTFDRILQCPAIHGRSEVWRPKRHGAGAGNQGSSRALYPLNKHSHGKNPIQCGFRIGD